MFRLIYTKAARKDWKKAEKTHLREVIEKLLSIIRENPFQYPPPFEKLEKEFIKSYSRRINGQHRLVYQVYEKEKIVKVIRMWTHYE